MYNPLMVICNYALAKLSGVEVEGLPPFSEDRQLIFVRNHERPVRSYNHNRECRARPDIVLLQWQFFQELTERSSYSDWWDYEKVCASNLDLGLFWNHVRSTVEVQFIFTRSPKHSNRKTSFDKEFGALKESGPWVSPNDSTQPRFIEEAPGPNFNCEHV
jgi:hypothetical protein